MAAVAVGGIFVSKYMMILEQCACWIPCFQLVSLILQARHYFELVAVTGRTVSSLSCPYFWQIYQYICLSLVSC